MTMTQITTKRDLKLSAQGLESIPNNGSWNPSFAVGKTGESAGCQVIEAAGFTILERAQGYQPDFDVRYLTPEGEEQTLEMKTDQTRYPNVFIEFREVGTETNKLGQKQYRPSGLYKTKADYYGIYHTNQKRLYMAPAESIREFIGKNTLHPARNGKSNTRPDGYLIPQARWLEIEGAQVFDFD